MWKERRIASSIQAIKYFDVRDSMPESRQLKRNSFSSTRGGIILGASL